MIVEQCADKTQQMRGRAAYVLQIERRLSAIHIFFQKTYESGDGRGGSLYVVRDGEQQTLPLPHELFAAVLRPLQIKAVLSVAAHVAAYVEEQHHGGEQHHGREQYYLVEHCPPPCHVVVEGNLHRQIGVCAYVFQQLVYAPRELHAHRLHVFLAAVKVCHALDVVLRLGFLYLCEHSSHGVAYVDTACQAVGNERSAVRTHAHRVVARLPEGVGKASEEVLPCLHHLIHRLASLPHSGAFGMDDERVSARMQVVQLAVEM